MAAVGVSTPHRTLANPLPTRFTFEPKSLVDASATLVSGHNCEALTRRHHRGGNLLRELQPRRP